MAEGDENRVVTADSSECIFRRSSVEGARDRLGSGCRSLQYHHVAGGLSKDHRVADQLVQALLAQLARGKSSDRRDVAEVLGNDVAGGRLRKAELANIAGERRLRDAETALAQHGEKLVLRVDR